MKALGMYIFGGSQTIGHLNVGWEVNTILEMTNDMIENNSYHFVKNYPNINIVLPSEWDKEDYINKLKNTSIDLLFANPPCSGLSSINRNANVDSDTNNHIYEVVEMIDEIHPHSFLIENAPTLTTLGLPILKKIQDKLKNNYRLSIINDFAGNHGVPMQRRRTLVVGWRRDTFVKMPIIHQQIKDDFKVRDALKDIDNLQNLEFDIYRKDPQLEVYYNKVNTSESILKTIAREFDIVKDELSDKDKAIFERFIERLKTKKSVWDKSAYRLDENKYAPSLTSVSQYIHPIENRDLYIREYARLMGYPDEFIFYQEECKCSAIQCIAQGVPVKFIEYISNEIKNQFNKREYYEEDCDVIYINQTNGIQKIVKYLSNEFQICKSINKKEDIIREEELW